MNAIKICMLVSCLVYLAVYVLLVNTKYSGCFFFFNYEFQSLGTHF